MKKPPAPPRACTAGEPEFDICQTAKKLAKLFNLVETDAPDALLSHGPAPKNIVDALRVLLDIVFPGKILRIRRWGWCRGRWCMNPP